MLSLDSTELTAADARFLAQTYAATHCPRLDRSAVALVVAELLSNAERHTAGTWRLAIRHSTRLLSIAVHDLGRLSPMPGSSALDGTGHFGLHIIRRLSHHFAVHTDATGKTVTAQWNLALL
ncbi:putative regulatory protein [Streptomyces sp. Tu6071]|uniref:ATP-binding protein n=1 Tax=Streptomyces evansiae TaxID=3075535 RepID=A0ABD5E6C2_9ACTN|nr:MULTISPECIES: ATP-binding protein [unclassified Streptomyces]EGJ74948.1 putative regulatory protein [Streptomyces sp. Tu6071]MDT0416546.1 ATP-binding protein [Streptomyces sp. DSM 41982]SCE06691.1 Histidine kinase-like ATPase domain-containing protein [Streptomyces sp. SolWspMP-sol7th]